MAMHVCFRPIAVDRSVRFYVGMFSLIKPSPQRILAILTWATFAGALALPVILGASNDILVMVAALPLLLAASLLLGGWGLIQLNLGGCWRKAALPMIALVALIPTYLATLAFRDEVTFWTWIVPLHFNVLTQASAADGVVMQWGGWGFAGMDNSQYLVRDTSDRIGSLDEADQFSARLGLGCEIVRSNRMWSQLFLVTTSNCDFKSPNG